jgi:hypothetical protein
MAAKKKSKRVEEMDHGTDELKQHGEFEQVAGNIAGVSHVVNRTADQLQTYHRRNSIDRAMYEAGERFQVDFDIAGLGPNYATMDLNRVRSMGGNTAHDHQQNARWRIAEAMDHLGKPLDSLIVHVVGHGHSASSWPSVAYTKRPDREGMVALRIALKSLADYYLLT